MALIPAAAADRTAPRDFLHVRPCQKNLNSDEHFDRSFSFVAMEGKLRKQKEMTAIRFTVKKQIPTNSREGVLQ
jgi:hypothetical protein